MTAVRCFLLVPLERDGVPNWRRSLRRYASARDGAPPCSNPRFYHDASVYLDNVWADDPGREWTADDPRWPTVCARCGYAFNDDHERQLFTEHVYTVDRTAGGLPAGPSDAVWPPGLIMPGVTLTLRDAPPGALWYADWFIPEGGWPSEWNEPAPEGKTGRGWGPGPDGRVLCCQTPGGQWMIDGRASNCGSPADNQHRCWVRHGEPPDVTVDKDGLTCTAGAGSIQAGGWHGFLRGGMLVA